jgi:hypothetical protein
MKIFGRQSRHKGLVAGMLREQKVRCVNYFHWLVLEEIVSKTFQNMNGTGPGDVCLGKLGQL